MLLETYDAVVNLQQSNNARPPCHSGKSILSRSIISISPSTTLSENSDSNTSTTIIAHRSTKQNHVGLVSKTIILELSQHLAYMRTLFYGKKHHGPMPNTRENQRVSVVLGEYGELRRCLVSTRLMMMRWWNFTTSLHEYHSIPFVFRWIMFQHWHTHKHRRSKTQTNPHTLMKMTLTPSHHYPHITPKPNSLPVSSLNTSIECQFICKAIHLFK